MKEATSGGPDGAGGGAARTPVVETDRLLLRIPEERDLDAWATFMADEEASRFLGGVQGRAAAWRAMAAMRGSWSLRGFGMFSVIEKESERWVGRVGPWAPEGWPGTEVGWGIAPAFQRRGYAVEAAVASIDWSFENLGWSDVIHCIDPANAPSIAVARKLGSERIGHEPDLRPFGIPVDIYGQSRQAWRENRRRLLRR